MEEFIYPTSNNLPFLIVKILLRLTIELSFVEIIKSYKNFKLWLESRRPSPCTASSRHEKECIPHPALYFSYFIQLCISHTSALIVLMSLIKIYLRVRDYGEYANQLVYSEDSTTFDNEIVKTAEGGMDVFIRKK